MPNMKPGSCAWQAMAKAATNAAKVGRRLFAALKKVRVFGKNVNKVGVSVGEFGRSIGP